MPRRQPRIERFAAQVVVTMLAKRDELPRTLEQLNADLSDSSIKLRNLELPGRASEAQRQKLGEEFDRLRKGIQSTRTTILSHLQDRRLHMTRTQRAYASWLFVNACLLLLYGSLFFLRATSAEDWTQQMGSYWPLRRNVNEALRTFKAEMRTRGVRQSVLSYQAMATAFRTWSDQFGPEASTEPGWLKIATEISRELRYRYHRYRTRELWAIVRSGMSYGLKINPRTGKQQHVRNRPLDRLRLFVRASARSVYGLLSGYGLRGARFAWWTFVILTFFSAAYVVADIVTGCGPKTPSLTDAINYFAFSLGAFTTVGKVNNVYCSTNANAGISQVLASTEALFGYIMIGILISMFLSSVHEVDTRISSVSIPTFPLGPDASEPFGAVGVTSPAHQTDAESGKE